MFFPGFAENAFRLLDFSESEKQKDAEPEIQRPPVLTFVQ